MSKNEEQTALENKVINFLCDNEKIAITNEKQQGRATRIFESVSIRTCLPHFICEFDNKGVMFLGLSEKDTGTFRKLFQERWPVVRSHLQNKDKVYDSTSQNNPRWEVVSMAFDAMEFARERWEEENSRYDFPSLEGRARSFYDSCRNEHVTPEP
ncbi:MAG: hypothetical protein KAJ29_06735 [Alphaproteobacteria bacterium]|nr:hypothetical protein [Alphaproteobacteria bacterium]